MKILRSMAVLAAMLGQSALPARSLSPASWSAAERIRLEGREAAIWPTEVRISTGARGLVTGTSSPIAVHAGADALRAGGTAADAAIAVGLTQITTMVGANVSFAGVAELVYFEARTRRVYVLDAGWGTWRGEYSPSTIPNADIGAITGKIRDTSGAAGRKALVPGFMAGVETMHRRFGRLPFARLFDPAIWYARHGVPVSPLLSAYFTGSKPVLETTAEGRAFLMPDGKNLPQIGQLYLQPALATTLEAVSRQGALYMYRGAWAQHYVDELRARGGMAAMADMAAYAPSWTEPLSIHLSHATLFGPDSDNGNGCAALMALNILEHRPAMRPYWKDPAALRTMALANRAAFFAPYAPEIATFEKRGGIGGSCSARLTPAYGAATAAALDTLGAGNGRIEAGHHSGSVVAVDRRGNVAALVHSSNTPLWGDTGMVVDGVPVPTPGGLYQAKLARLAPGARLPSDMAPMILVSGGKPEAAIATIGTSLVPETVRLMLAAAHGEDPAEWLAAPPLLLNIDDLQSPLMGREELVPVGSYPPELLARARAIGLAVREIDAQRTLVLRGTAVLALIRPRARKAVEVPKVMGFAEAE
jgi:gamma-glutamyltranspeptidase/glutathione hydrolase